ncbi:MAG: hypothetical protein IKI19_08270 [Prevotella sp.]|nr:hypothetical protein [Prevotella sp.]
MKRMWQGVVAMPQHTEQGAWAIAEGTLARESKEKMVFSLLFARLFVPLPKISEK